MKLKAGDRLAPHRDALLVSKKNVRLIFDNAAGDLFEHLETLRRVDLRGGGIDHGVHRRDGVLIPVATGSTRCGTMVVEPEIRPGIGDPWRYDKVEHVRGCFGWI